MRMLGLKVMVILVVGSIPLLVMLPILVPPALLSLVVHRR